MFLKVAKQGSTLAGIMDAFAISVSHGLQYGVPLEAFVEMFTNMRFEPAGMTDDPDIRFATSLVDYIFRKLAVLYLPHVEERVEIGVLTTGERTQPTLPGVEESTVVDETHQRFAAAGGSFRRRCSSRTSRWSPPATPTPTSAKHEVVLTPRAATSCSGPAAVMPCPSCCATSGCS